ncbi:hypothetical protein RhiirA4_463020 [Rhizophagus irregularis]|uniref:Uncharacterized protein n=1 Tax=Rhizophagus irregularis TaxID=588596 RepID=A0A2I1GM25_9GLOM|nr:hypothetical protein RhiirA4_463020 [Rhizophagus irregularis]
MAKNDTKNTQICLEKVQNVLCNFIEEEFVTLLEVVLGRLVKTSSTGVYQGLQDRFDSKMLNYLSKDFFDNFVDTRMKTGTSNANTCQQHPPIRRLYFHVHQHQKWKFLKTPYTNHRTWPSLPTSIGCKKPLKTSTKKDPKSSNKSFKKSDKKIKSQQHASEKMISTIMTGYEPILKNNIREIVVYDIPFKWTQIEILNYLKAWGNVLALKFKTQKKYVTVIVSIDPNDAALSQWNEEVWTAPLRGLPVQWFSAAWDLKQCKEHENFQIMKEAMEFNNIYSIHKIIKNILKKVQDKK